MEIVMKATNTQWIFGSLFLVLLLLPLTSLTAEEREFKVAIDSSWPPFRMIENKTYSGIDFDVWREVAKRLNLKLNFIEFPWPRSLLNMKEGCVDGMSGLAKRPEREEYMYYTNPTYYTCTTVFYVLKGNSSLIQKYEDLYKYQIGFVIDSAYFDKFDKDLKIRKHSLVKEIQLFKMLEYKRFDAFIGTDCQAEYEITQEGYKDVFEKANYKPGNDVHLYIAISKKSIFANELPKFNETIRKIVDEGKVREFVKKYIK
jgi:polar amino acid transport system substrate-binding protein